MHFKLVLSVEIFSKIYCKYFFGKYVSTCIVNSYAYPTYLTKGSSQFHYKKTTAIIIIINRHNFVKLVQENGTFYPIVVISLNSLIGCICVIVVDFALKTNLISKFAINVAAKQGVTYFWHKLLRNQF